MINVVGDSYFGRVKERVQAIQNNRGDDGFSLLELIIVVVIIGIIVAIAIPIFGNVQDSARQSVVEESARAGLASAQYEVSDNGNSADVETVLDTMSNEDVLVSLVGDYSANNVDSICVRADYQGYDNFAIAGNGCEGDGEPVPPVEDDNDSVENSGLVLNWSVSADRGHGELFEHVAEVVGDFDGLSVTIPVQGNVSGTIDWGDGTVTELSGSNPSHTYESDGDYEIVIEDARFDTWSNGNIEEDVMYSNLLGLRSIDGLENTGVRSFNNGFVRALDLESIGNIPSGVTDMSLMFFRGSFF